MDCVLISATANRAAKNRGVIRMGEGIWGGVRLFKPKTSTDFLKSDLAFGVLWLHIHESRELGVAVLSSANKE